MCAAKTSWPALIGSLALGCLLPQFGGAQWSSPESESGTRRGGSAADKVGSGQVRFVPSADDAAAPADETSATDQGPSRANLTTNSLADPSGDFAITPNGEVVQAAYQSSSRNGPALRTGPATKGGLLDHMSGNSAPPAPAAGRSYSRPFGGSAHVRSTAGQRATAGLRGSAGTDAPKVDPLGRVTTATRGTPARVSPARTPALAEPTSALKPMPTPANGDSEVERLLVTAHDLATSAATEDDLSRVITTCRQSFAIEADGQTGQYARQLASWALNRRGQLLASAGHTTEAMRDFQDAIRLDPQRWRAIHNRGVLMSQSGRFEQAFDDFSRTIQLQPDYAKAYSNRAALWVVAGKLRQATDDYRQAVQLDPGLAVARRGLGRCCHALGQLDEALQNFDAAIELDPNNAYSIACRADLLTDLGNYAEAAADYDRAIRLDPRSIEACRGSAWLLATCPDTSVRKPELAVERAKTAIQLDRKGQAVSYDTLAAALASAGQFRDAVQTIRRAIELAPADQRAVYQDRLQLYQHSQPFRIAPLQSAVPANYEH